jgi:protein-tyrosine phosphatase
LNRVDLHSHVLPGIDDGARDLDETLRMLRIAEHDGTTRIVATPHANGLALPVITQAVQAVNTAARAAGLSIVVLTGAEVRLAPTTAADFAAGKVVTIQHTPYVLLELPITGAWTSHVFSALHELQVAGAWPIVAHAERYDAVQRDPGIVERLVASNVLIQVNADALVGASAGRAVRAAELLARAHAIHLLASDAHSATHRPPVLTQAFTRLNHLAGVEHARFVQRAAAKVVLGEPIDVPDLGQRLEPRQAAWSHRLWNHLRGRTG